MIISTYRQNLIERLMARDGGGCRYCKIDVRCNWLDWGCNPLDATVDHVVPKAKGGTNDDKNLAVACRKCNHAKGDRSVAEFMADPRPLSERLADERKKNRPTKQFRNVRWVAVPEDTKRYDKFPRGTLAAMIRDGRTPVPRGATLKNDSLVAATLAQFPGSQIASVKLPPTSALEAAKRLREEHERRGKVWRLA